LGYFFLLPGFSVADNLFRYEQVTVKSFMDIYTVMLLAEVHLAPVIETVEGWETCAGTGGGG
jgi:hypothetical protein